MEIKNNKKKSQNLYFIICHYCKNMKNINHLINCTDNDCKESFCDTCINKIFNYNYKELKIEFEENGWICFKCRNLCKCKYCSKNNNSLNEKKINDNDLNNNFYPTIFNDFIEKGQNKFKIDTKIINKNTITKSKINILDILKKKN